mmetsp:Transcript_36669/g.72098  ORF Transcript_36669/g.72098 Transcript_36669/m.72098 type:complete len:258 (+) Transcript_36669:145-918(+)
MTFLKAGPLLKFVRIPSITIRLPSISAFSSHAPTSPSLRIDVATVSYWDIMNSTDPSSATWTMSSSEFQSFSSLSLSSHSHRLRTNAALHNGPVFLIISAISARYFITCTHVSFISVSGSTISLFISHVTIPSASEKTVISLRSTVAAVGYPRPAMRFVNWSAARWITCIPSASLEGRLRSSMRSFMTLGLLFFLESFTPSGIGRSMTCLKNDAYQSNLLASGSSVSIKGARSFSFSSQLPLSFWHHRGGWFLHMHR